MFGDLNVVNVDTEGRAPRATPRLGNVSSSCGWCGTEIIDDLYWRLQPLVGASPIDLGVLRSVPSAVCCWMASFPLRSGDSSSVVERASKWYRRHGRPASARCSPSVRRQRWRSDLPSWRASGSRASCEAAASMCMPIRMIEPGPRHSRAAVDSPPRRRRDDHRREVRHDQIRVASHTSDVLRTGPSNDGQNWQRDQELVDQSITNPWDRA